MYFGCRILASGRTRLVRNRLVIATAGAADNGVYSCRARNRAGLTDSVAGYILSITSIYTIILLTYFNPRTLGHDKKRVLSTFCGFYYYYTFFMAVKIGHCLYVGHFIL